jgi:hypothetical protein
MAFLKARGPRGSPAGKFDFPTAVPQLFQQNVPVVALDLYHTVFDCAPGPALCLELSSKLSYLRLIARKASNHRNAFPFAPFRFSSNPHHRIAAAEDGFLLMTRAFVGRSAALGTHPPVSGRVDNPMVSFSHLLNRPRLEIGDFKINSLRIIADLVVKANLSSHAGEMGYEPGVVLFYRF